jgi:catechol 2,3-dioxygenase-like lactoylglutathione lyase family enzyme
MISGISHITFIVKDLQRTALFFEKIFDAKEVYSSSTVKYFLINDLWIALNKGEPPSERSYNHIAFQITEIEFDSYVARIKEVGAEIRSDRLIRIAGEGRSIYFYDFDNHLFELHTGTLPERLESYLKLNEK